MYSYARTRAKLITKFVTIMSLAFVMIDSENYIMTIATVIL